MTSSEPVFATRFVCSTRHTLDAAVIALALLGLAAFSIPSAGCSSSTAVDASAITLATTLPLSSPDAAIAQAWQRGYARAVTEANGAGGVLLRATGQRVRVLFQVRDDAGEMARAQQQAEDLLSGGVHALLATPNAVRMATQAAVARRFARPYVVPAPYGPDLQATDRPWLFVAPRDGGSDEERAYLTARAAIDAFALATTLDAEAVRRAFHDVEHGSR